MFRKDPIGMVMVQDIVDVLEAGIDLLDEQPPYPGYGLRAPHPTIKELLAANGSISIHITNNSIIVDMELPYDKY